MRVKRKAAEKAKINVKTFISEPLAVIIGYANYLTLDKDQTILVYDLGGTSLDLAIYHLHFKDESQIVG